MILALAVLVAPAEANAEPLPLGQWVWSRGDSAVLARVRGLRADVRAGINVAEISWDGAARVQLRQSPRTANPSDELVIRLDDTLHAAWNRSPDEIAASLDLAMTRVLQAVARSGSAASAPVQLDYDCPVRRLSAWATVVRALRRGALAGRGVWITSLPAHVREPAYGRLFEGAVDGHIVQVFDNGEPYSSPRESHLESALGRAALPFRLGVGAFERGRRTDHAAWLPAIERLARLPNYRGTWIFAAGQDWSPLTRRLP